MFKTLNPRVWIIIFSIISSFLLVSNSYFNYVGWAVFGFSIIGLIFFCKKQILKIDIFLASVAILSASNFIFKTNGFTLFLSTITFLYSTGWLITKLPKDRFLQIFHLIFPFLYSLLDIFATKDTLPGLDNKKIENVNPKIVEVKVETAPSSVSPNPKSSNLIWSILTTILVLIIILPLLSYANPQFGKYLMDIFNIQWIKDIWNWIVENILSPVMIIRLCIAGFLYPLLPKLISNCQNSIPQEPEAKADLPLSIPKIVIIFTLFAFLAVQLQTTLQPELLTKTSGNIANETFLHLSIVCLIAFGLVYMNFKDKFSTKIWSLILLGQTSILGILAFLSDYNYVINWGLTHKRLYGFSVIALVAGLIGIFVYFAFKNTNKIITYFAMLFCLVAVVTNTINLDSLIYNNPPKEATGIEQDYVNNLSLDTGNLGERYLKVVEKYNTFPNETKLGILNCAEFNWINNYNNQIYYLKEKYKSNRILDWSYTEYTSFLKIKDIPITAIKYDFPTFDIAKIGFGSELIKQNCYTREYKPGSIQQL